MATTTDRNVGAIRIKLAALLEKLLPEYRFVPEELNSNTPIYASVIYDGCSWDGYGKDSSGFRVHVFSWDTMTACVRGGVKTIATRDGADYEIYAPSKVS